MKKLHKFKIFNNEAIIFEGAVEVSVPNEDEGTKVLMRLSDAILDEKIKSLRLIMPKRIIFITAHDKNHITMRAEDMDKESFN